jgi:hypothetical protein
MHFSEEIRVYPCPSVVFLLLLKTNRRTNLSSAGRPG